MSRLQYPLDLNPGMNDYVVFTSEEYRTNTNDKGFGGQSVRNAGPPSQGANIVLYMPTTTPVVKQGADWGQANFAGPMGQLLRNASTQAAAAIDAAAIPTSFEEGKAMGKKIVSETKKFFEGNAPLVGGAAKQVGVGMAASLAGIEANQLLAMQRGEIYNPNVELLYKGPKLRGFSFSFTLVPKSPAEAQAINNIILEFKKWSAPSDTGNGMYKVPHVWRVVYMNGGALNPNMNAFKKAALTDVAVQNNQGMNMHMSFEDGMPIITTISLNFTEVDVITREDHLSSGTNVGF
ncbi:baseplate tail tube cap [Synechococcus phage MA10]